MFLSVQQQKFKLRSERYIAQNSLGWSGISFCWLRIFPSPVRMSYSTVCRIQELTSSPPPQKKTVAAFYRNINAISAKCVKECLTCGSWPGFGTNQLLTLLREYEWDVQTAELGQCEETNWLHTELQCLQAKVLRTLHVGACIVSVSLYEL